MGGNHAFFRINKMPILALTRDAVAESFIPILLYALHIDKSIVANGIV